MMTKPRINTPDRSQPGSTRTAPSVPHQGGREKYVTGDQQKIRGRNNIAIATWNVRTLAQSGKLKELTHEMERYNWHIVGLCEARWLHSGVFQTDEGHAFYYSGQENKRANGVGFLVNKSIKNTILGCQPITDRLMTIRLHAKLFNITIIQVYAPTSDYTDEQIEEFYSRVQATIDKVDKKDIIIVQGDWNAKVGADAQQDWKEHCGTNCNNKSNERGLRLLEFAAHNKMVLSNTLGKHKSSRINTWHAPDGKHHSQIDYILVQSRFKAGINKPKTRTYPGADIGSDHDLVILNFNVRLKENRKAKSNRLKFNLDKLKDPTVATEFQAEIGGRFAPLLLLEEDVETITNNFNSIIVESAKKVLGKQRKKVKPWITEAILDLCDTRRSLKKKRNTVEEKAKYRGINKKIRREMKSAKQKWINDQCADMEDCLTNNNTKQAFQLVKDLTRQKQSTATTIKDKNGNNLTEETDILNRWTEYCSELYNYQSKGDTSILTNQESTNDDNFPILREEVENAIKSLKTGKSAGNDNIPAELLKSGGNSVVDILTAICNKIWETGEWPEAWTQSLIITLPKKGNLQLCQNYRTISLISHASKVMLKVILKRLQPQAENIIAEEQAGFRKGRSTIEQIFNLRLLCEKHLEQQKDLFHVFIDFKKAFDRVWHDALWATMKKFNIGKKLINSIQQLYSRATSAVMAQGTTGKWFHTSVGVRQGCLLSPTLFNIFLEEIMNDALEDHSGTISIGGRSITNLRFADDIDGIAGTEQELASLVKRLDESSTRYGMEISAEKTKLMTNKDGGISADIKVHDVTLETVENFKYLGAIISDKGSKPEILSRIALTTAALTKLRKIWKDHSISTGHKIRLMRALVLSIFLYACETWTLTSALQKKIQATEMRCFRNILGISYIEHVTNERVKEIIESHIGPYKSLLSVVKERKLKWYGHTTRAAGMPKLILQGTVEGRRKRGRQRKRWADNIKEWTGLPFAKSQMMAHDRAEWRRVVYSAAMQCPNDSTLS